jgi:hypothetical protein
MIPALRTPVVLDGYRGSGVGDPNKNYRLLVDLSRLQLQKGQTVFLSPSNDLRLLLRGARTMKTKQGQITGEIDPLEVKFENGLLVIDDSETDDILMKHPQRKKLFFAREDIEAMQDDVNERKMEEILSAVGDQGIERLKQKLEAKGFNLSRKSAKEAKA